MQILGIDIGGSGIKGAPVNVETGQLAAERYRLATPEPSRPDDVGDVVELVAHHFAWQGPIGCTFPAIIRDGIAYSAANVDPAWIGTDGRRLLQQKTGCPVCCSTMPTRRAWRKWNLARGAGKKASSLS